MCEPTSASGPPPPNARSTRHTLGLSGAGANHDQLQVRTCTIFPKLSKWNIDHPLTKVLREAGEVFSGTEIVDPDDTYNAKMDNNGRVPPLTCGG